MHDVLDIYCLFSGYPAPLVTWTRDDEPITNSSHMVLENVDDSLNGRLIVSNVKLTDNGIYTCEATSEEFPDEVVSVDINVWIKGKYSMAIVDTMN